MTVDLFGTSSEEQIDETKDYLSELVGEDKRYKTPAELAKSKVHADRMIEQLKKEKEEALAQLRGMSTIEEYLARIQRPADPPKEPDQRPSEDGLTEEAILNKVELKLQEREAKRSYEENLRLVQVELQKADVTQTDIRARARELDMTEAEATALAQTKPRVFLDLFAKNGRPQAPSNLPNGFNTTGQTQQSQTRGLSFYEAMKKRDVKEYYTPGTQLQMQKDIIALGYDKFKSI